MSVLVDTAVWSVALRRDGSNLNIEQHRVLISLQELISKSQAELLAPVRQELLSGIRQPLQFERVRRALRAYLDVPLTTEDFEEAARMSNVCRAKGIAGSGVDHLICATAARRDWSIFTLDQDFVQYAKLLPIKLHKIK